MSRNPHSGRAARQGKLARSVSGTTSQVAFTGTSAPPSDDAYERVIAEVSELLNRARRIAVRSVNAVMTTTYWEIGRRIVEFEQDGAERAEYGAALVNRMAKSLSTRFGRGFGRVNLQSMRQFYLSFPKKSQTLSGISGKGDGTASGESFSPFPLPWSHYVRLLAVSDPHARAFYETEALRGGWSVRQLDRQIGSLFYERTALSRDKAAMLTKHAAPRPEDKVSVEEEIKSPFVLEFLNLKDEYSEHDIEEALIRHLETFLLELGGDFAFVSRQKRLRIGTSWYRMDLVFFHRRLRCLMIVDLKTEPLTPGDVGQMHFYLNYAKEHWTLPGENPPVGLILCTRQDHALAHYALDGIANTILAAEYRTALPDAEVLAAEVTRTRQLLEARRAATHEHHQ